MEIKAKYAVFRPNNLLLLGYRQRDVQEFCQEANSIAVEKFRTISSWFNKPSIASPSADIALLFKAVVSEIKGFFPEYTPQQIIEDSEFIITGGVYFVIYDALFILIYNAAKYGKKDGLLKISISPRITSDGTSINIVVVSDIAPNDLMLNVENFIKSALEGDCEDALVIEGRSGIKKLLRLQQDNYIGKVAYKFNEKSVCASFDFKINY